MPFSPTLAALARIRFVAMRGAFAAASVLCCSSTPEGSLVLARDAALDLTTPTTLVLEEIKGGVRRELSRKPWATGGLELGTLNRGESGAFRAYGLDAKGVPSHGGKTLEIAYDSLDSARIPLFLAPTQKFVHLPGTVDTTVNAAPFFATDRVVVLPGQGAVLTGYDLLALTSIDLIPNPKAASMAAVSSTLLLVNPGSVHSYDLSTSTDTTLANLPDAADVAGGTTIAADATHVYIAGPTRATPSSTVWYWGGEATVARTGLSAPRSQAAVVFATGIGLVVLGGDVENAEVVTPGASQAFALPAPTKDVRAACSMQGTQLLVVRSTGVVETFDASCRQSCTFETWAQTVMPPSEASLACVRGRALYASRDAAGLLHVFSLAKDKIEELAVPAGRTKGVLFPLSTEHVALVGGGPTIDVVSAPETLAPR